MPKYGYTMNYDLKSNDLNEEQLKKILEYSFDEIFVVNRHGIVAYVNEACEKHYGLKPWEVIGKTVHHLVSEGYYNPALAPLVFREKKQITLEQETRLGKKLLVTATPMFDDQGEIDFIVMNSRDITQIEQLRQDLDKTKKLVERYRSEVNELRQQQINCFEGYTFRSEKMKRTMEIAQRVAAVDTTVLISGQSGTGKNQFAKAIHKLSKRNEGPFISINCAAIPETLLESELFGYCKGAFTGAEKSGKPGLVELANNGTLFLDEIGEIPLTIQAKLLQLIQDHTFLPIGGTEQKNVSIRIVAATNRDLPQLVQQGKFREDLYYRLNVIEIEIPPLKERHEDIIPLLYYFLNHYDDKYGLSHQFSQECLEHLTDYSWPGNIREMEHLVERLVITVPESQITSNHLPKKLHSSAAAVAVKQIELETSPEANLPAAGKSLKAAEVDLIIDLYKKLQSTYKVADALNVSQSKVSRIIRKHLSV